MDKPGLFQEQITFGRYLRDPDHCAPPGHMDAARAQVYRDLIFANLSQLLSATFPVLIRILGEARWRLLVRSFLRDHRARTPKFGEIAEEFVGFVATVPQGDWPGFMVELAHYEWVEMALQQSDADPCLSALAQAYWIARYAFRPSPGHWRMPGRSSRSGRISSRRCRRPSLRCCWCVAAKTGA